ncbi:MAG: hypothetical protein L0Y71_20755, partial [Gemmataceae bacterium]|nr:hypothetical protein [Gemmataceae bacterium]
MDTARLAGMIGIASVVTLGVVGVDRWNKDAKTRHQGDVAQADLAQAKCAAPMPALPVVRDSTISFQVDPAEPMLPPIPKESAAPPLVSSGELEKKLKQSIDKLHKALDLPVLNETEPSVPPPADVSSKPKADDKAPLPPLPAISSVPPASAAPPSVPPPSVPPPPVPPVGNANEAPLPPPVALGSAAKVDPVPPPVPPVESAEPIDSVKPLPPVPALNKNTDAKPAAPIPPPPVRGVAADSGTPAAPPMPFAPPMPSPVGVAPPMPAAPPMPSPPTRAVDGFEAPKPAAAPPAVISTRPPIPNQPPNRQPTNEFQQRLNDLEMKYLKLTIGEIERRLEKLPSNAAEHATLDADRKRMTERLAQLVQAAPEPFDGPTDNLWALHLETVDGKTVVQAIVHQKARFKIMCERLDLQAPIGTLRAVGDVRISGEGFQGSCDRLSITLHQDRLLLEGNAEVGIRTRPLPMLEERLEEHKEGLAKEGLAKEGLAKEGLAKEGLAKEGLAKEG